MKVVLEKHPREQRFCSHTRRVWAVLETTGPSQIRYTCVDCGNRTPQAAARNRHPNAADYPVIRRFTGDEPPVPIRRVESGQYDDYLRSDEWRSKRDYYLGRAMHRCQLCNKPGGPGGRGLQVHHRTYERVGAELDADVIVLCGDCHGRHHGHLAEHAEHAA